MSSPTHLVLMPTFNTGARLREVVLEALRHWPDVLVVTDGCTDGTEALLAALAPAQPGLHVLVCPHNGGKGAAVLAGARWAADRGFTHALVMDADGQHPAASIAEFMAVSQGRPAALVLGRPIFPPNIPAERLHGRKLSVGLVRCELLGAGVADPLFGFRVYPLAELLEVMGPRRGGRRYDFDTEAAVRLAWAGVPPVNIPAPVRYFSRAEGGVSHFHYLRDNVTLVGMHLRLLVELLFWRWPALLRHRRVWRHTGVALALALVLAGGPALRGAEPSPLPDTAQRLPPGAASWSDLSAAFARSPEVTADFTETRQFPFRREPVVLQGEARVSASRGLSLHYLPPQEQIVILDEAGILVRAAAGQKAPPMDPRAAPANEALRHVLRFDLAGLESDFELFGERHSETWSLWLEPRTDALRRMVGRIHVTGEGAAIRFIEIRRTPRQSIQIAIAPPRALAPFNAEDVRKFFR